MSSAVASRPARRILIATSRPSSVSSSPENTVPKRPAPEFLVQFELPDAARQVRRRPAAHADRASRGRAARNSRSRPRRVGADSPRAGRYTPSSDRKGQLARRAPLDVGGDPRELRGVEVTNGEPSQHLAGGAIASGHRTALSLRVGASLPSGTASTAYVSLGAAPLSKPKNRVIGSLRRKCVPLGRCREPSACCDTARIAMQHAPKQTEKPFSQRCGMSSAAGRAGTYQRTTALRSALRGRTIVTQMRYTTAMAVSTLDSSFRAGQTQTTDSQHHQRGTSRRAS